MKEMVIRRIHLNEMPFDRWINGQRNVHATGDFIFTNMGFSGIEYEDYDIPDAPDCVEEWEEDENDE